MRGFLRNLWAIFLKELAAFFLSPVAYVILFLFVLSGGWTFWHYSAGFAHEPQNIPLILRSLFSFALFWILPLSPLLTMRLFAEEKRTGTLEMLMTAPVTEPEVVLGKFLATQLFYMLIWSSLLIFPGILEAWGEPDWGPVLAIYCGVFFLGLLTNALGLLASAATRNQLVAAVLALSGNLFFFVLALGGWVFSDMPDLRRLFHYLSFTTHFSSEYTQGVVDLRYLGYYLGFTALFLFYCVRLVEARKWR